MLFQPTNITPSSFAGVGGDLIDANEDMVITWQVNGSSAMTGYEITIYQNDSQSTQLYTTGHVTISPFYGVDGMGNVQLYSVTIPSSTLSGAGIVNGSGDGYKYKITQYWSATEYVEQSAENYFIAQEVPDVGISTDTLYSPSDSIEGYWSQSDGVGMEWVRWVVTEVNNSTTLVDTGNIYTQVLSLSYDGWVNGKTYSVTMSYQLQNGYAGSVNAVISASWTNVTQRGEATVALSGNCSSAIVSYPVPSYAEIQNAGAVTATISNGKLINPSGSTLTWNGELCLASSSRTAGIVWCGTPTSTVTITVFGGVVNPLLTENLTITINPNGIVSWSVGSISNSYNTGVSFSGKVVYFVAAESNWYISVYDGNSTNVFFVEAPIVPMYFTADITSPITLSGEQTCNFIGVLQSTASASYVNNLLHGGGSQPEFTPDWLFLSDFAAIGYQSLGSLNDISWAGVLPTVSSVSIYRIESGASIMQKVVTVTNTSDVGRFQDFGIVSSKTYTYSVQFSFSDSSLSAYTVILTTGRVTPCYWDWLLAEAELNADGTYHVIAEYRFGLNVATEVMSNNNVPAIMQNFTRYPTRQGVSANYRSGTLSAFIGKVDTERNIYIDTAAQADAIMALGASTNAKFLRSRKGEIWMVDTSVATTMQVGDKYREQPYTVTLGWTEIGDASGVSIIALPSDSIWTGETVTTPVSSDRLSINGLEVNSGATIVIGG